MYINIICTSGHRTLTSLILKLLLISIFLNIPNVDSYIDLRPTQLHQVLLFQFNATVLFVLILEKGKRIVFSGFV
jgi:hypothetical protein